jgi:hypothetical protein
LFNLPAQRWLSDMQRFGGQPETPSPGDFRERHELSQVKRVITKKCHLMPY